MANTKASKKDILTNKRNRNRNLQERAEIKQLFKSIKKLNDENSLKQHLNLIYKKLDQTSQQAINVSKANRLKSRAFKLIKENIENLKGATK